MTRAMPLLLMILFVGPGNVRAEASIQSIRIFEIEDQFVLKDARLPQNLPIRVYRMDAKAQATARINLAVKERVSRLDRLNYGNYEAANRRAFSDLLNSSEWSAINQELEAGSLAIEAALRFQIQKLPAIVFNDRHVVYGQRSLEAAMDAFTREEAR